MLNFIVEELKNSDHRSRVGQKVKIRYNFNNLLYEGLVKISRICNGKLEHYVKLDKPAIIDGDSFSFLLVYEEEIVENY